MLHLDGATVAGTQSSVFNPQEESWRYNRTGVKRSDAPAGAGGGGIVTLQVDGLVNGGGVTVKARNDASLPWDDVGAEIVADGVSQVDAGYLEYLVELTTANVGAEPVDAAFHAA